jgi:hypothetical protein
MHAARSIGFAQGALRDHEVDHRRHVLHFETPDDPFGLDPEIVRGAAHALCAALQGAGHGDSFAA